MSTFSLDDLDTHIANLQSQLSFLTSALDATDSQDPEWLDAELITLKGKTSMLVGDMRRVRKGMRSECVRANKAASNRKRLSAEGVKPYTRTEETRTGQGGSDSSAQPTPPANQNDPQDRNSDLDTEPADEYQVQFVDITEEVNRRLRESRLRQLQDSPSTSQKRKYNALEYEKRPTRDDDYGDAGDGDTGKSPTKKIKAFGQFEQVLKPKEGVKRGGIHLTHDDWLEEREDVKRRKI